jgi:hypothetical protein
MLTTLLALALAPPATATVVIAAEPPRVARAFAAYQDCLYRVIDRQYAAGATTYSEPKVLADCVTVRRIEAANALAASKALHRPSSNTVLKKFAALDESVWTIVGHLRAKSGERH